MEIDRGYLAQHLYVRQIALLKTFAEFVALSRLIDLGEDNREGNVIGQPPKWDVGLLAEVVAAVNTGFMFISDAKVVAALMDSYPLTDGDNMQRRMKEASEAATYLKERLETAVKNHKEYGALIKVQLARLTDLCETVNQTAGTFSTDLKFFRLIQTMLTDVKEKTDIDTWDIPF
jgi:hypothetical protein